MVGSTSMGGSALVRGRGGSPSPSPTRTFNLHEMEMKQRLRVMEHQVRSLRNENSQIQARYHQNLEASEKKCLRYSKQIDTLAQQLENLVERNVDVIAEKEELGHRAERVESRIKVLETNAGTLRELVTEYLTAPSDEAKRSFHEKEFWEKFATPKILAESEPPRSYDYENQTASSINRTGEGPEASMVRGDLGYSVLRAHPVHTSELEKTMARLKIATTENQRLRTQLEKIQKENICNTKR